MKQITGKAVVTPREDKNWTVEVEWNVDVDRRNTGGWVVPARYLDKLVRAVNDQKAFKLNGNGQGEILTDVNGRTYVNWQSRVYGKRLNKDLKQLGY